MPNTSPTFKIVQASSVAKAHFHGTLTSPMVNPSPRWWNAATELTCPDLMLRDEYKSFGWTWTKNWTKIEQRSSPSTEGIPTYYFLDVATSRRRSLQHCLEVVSTAPFTPEGQQRYNTCAKLFCAKVLQRIPAARKATKGKTKKPHWTPRTKMKHSLNSKVILQLGTTRDSAFQKQLMIWRR